jgi:alpha-aminoadipate/glutamate carrier protein LysW
MRIFTVTRHLFTLPRPKSLTRALYNNAFGWGFAQKGEIPVTKCPECDAEIDFDEDEVEEGEILSCPECDVELEVTQTHPVHLIVLSEDDEDDEEDADEESSVKQKEDEEEEEEAE